MTVLLNRMYFILCSHERVLCGMPYTETPAHFPLYNHILHFDLVLCVVCGAHRWWWWLRLRLHHYYQWALLSLCPSLSLRAQSIINQKEILVTFLHDYYITLWTHIAPHLQTFAATAAATKTRMHSIIYSSTEEFYCLHRHKRTQHLSVASCTTQTKNNLIFALKSFVLCKMDGCLHCLTVQFDYRTCASSTAIAITVIAATAQRTLFFVIKIMANQRFFFCWRIPTSSRSIRIFGEEKAISMNSFWKMKWTRFVCHFHGHTDAIEPQNDGERRWTDSGRVMGGW